MDDRSPEGVLKEAQGKDTDCHTTSDEDPILQGTAAGGEAECHWR